MSLFELFEGDITKRIEKAKEKAQRIISGKTEDIDETILSLRLVLAEHYNMPLFHDYFENRTLDDLILEIELVKRENLSGAQSGSKILTENKKEAEGLFDDWIEEDMSESPISDEEWKETAKKFMQTGEFKEDDPGEKSEE